MNNICNDQVINNEKLGLFYLASLLIIYCLAIMSIFPPIRALSFFNYIWPLLMTVWLLTSFLSSPAYFLKPSRHQLVGYIFFAYVIIIPHVSGNGFIGNRFLELFQILIFYWAYDINMKRGRQKYNERITLFLVPIVIVICVNTILKLSSSLYASRLAKKDTMTGIELMSQGVGGYEFIYFLVFVSASILYLILDKKTNLKAATKGGIGALLILSLVTIVLSNFMLAFLLIIIMLLIRIFLPYLAIKLVIFNFFTLMIVVFFLPTIINFIISVSDQPMNIQRLIELREFISHGVIGLSSGARLEAFQESVYGIFNNPLTGSVFTIMRSGTGDYSGFGQHSFLLDMFSIFGVIIGVIGLYVLFQPLIKLLNRSSMRKKISLPFLMLMLSGIFFLVNNLSPSIGFAIYFVYPTIYNFMLDKYRKNYLLV